MSTPWNHCKRERLVFIIIDVAVAIAVAVAVAVVVVVAVGNIIINYHDQIEPYQVVQGKMCGDNLILQTSCISRPEQN